jgi:hypothetical protein
MASPFDNNPQLQYDLRAAQVAGLTEKDIAMYASERRNYDYDAARKAGLDDADIIRYNIANVSGAGGAGAFAQEAIPALVTAPAVGYGMAKGFQTGLKVPGPPVAKFGAGILGALVGAVIPSAVGAAVTDEVKERAGLDGQYVPSAQPGAQAGTTFGFITGFGLPTIARGAVSKLAGSKVGNALGLKPLGTPVAQAGDDVFLQTGANKVNLGASVFLDDVANSSGMTKAFGEFLKRQQNALTSSRGRRLESPALGLATDAGIGAGAALGRGVAEATDPGNVLLGVGAEVVGGTLNVASLLNRVGGRVADLAKRGFYKVQPGRAADENRARATMQRMVDDFEQAATTAAQRPDGSVDLKVMEKTGLDLKEIIDALDATDPTIFGAAGKAPILNAAEKSNSELMRLLGATLLSLRGSDQSEFLRAGVIAQSKQAAEGIGAILDTLSVIENPGLMSEVSRLKEDTFKGLIEGVLNAHTLKAIDVGNRLGNRTDVTPTQAAKQIIDTVFRANEATRAIESGLWGNTEKKTPIAIPNIIKKWNVETNVNAGGTEAAKKLYIPYLNTWIDERKAEAIAREQAIRAKRNKEVAQLENEIKNEAYPLRAFPAVEKTLATIETKDGLAEFRNVLDEVFEANAAIDPVKAEANLQGTQRSLETARRQRDESPSWMREMALNDVTKLTNKRDEETKLVLQSGSEVPQTIKSLRDKFSQIDELNAPINEPITATSGQLLKFRSQMLRNARVTDATEAGAAQSGYYSAMAEKALDDLIALPGEGLGLSGKQRAAFDTARAFSKAYNDVFTRAYGGQLMQKVTSGADRVTPERLANTLILEAGNETAGNLRQLDEAMDFVIKKQRDPFIKAEMRNLKKYGIRGNTEIILRDFLSKGAIDPLTKQISRPKVAQLLQEYKEVFDLPAFATVGRDLQRADTAQLLLNKVREDITTAGYKTRKTDLPGAQRIRPVGKPRKGETTVVPRGTPDFEVPVLAQRGKDIDSFRTFLANKEKPTVEIITIRNSNNPERQIRGLAKLARTGNKSVKGNAVKGFQQVVIDAAVENSRRTSGNLRGTVDFYKFNEFLNEPMAANKKSLREVLRDEKVLTDQEFNDLATLTDYGQRVERILTAIDADNPNAAIADIIESGNLLFQAVSSAAGATTFTNIFGNLASAIPFIGRVRSPGIVEAGLGAELARKYLTQLPGQAVEAILFETFKDPKKMSAMLKQLKNPADVRAVHRVQRPIIESIIGLEGYREIEERIGNDAFFEETETVEEAPVAAAPAPSEPLVNVREPIPAMPVPSPPPVDATVPLPQLPVPGGSPNRSQYAAMFPFDSVSEVIRSQEGIGSLMQ